MLKEEGIGMGWENKPLRCVVQLTRIAMEPAPAPRWAAPQSQSAGKAASQAASSARQPGHNNWGGGLQLGEVTSTDLKLSRLCRLPVKLKLPDLMSTMLMLMLMIMTIEMMRMVYMSKSGRSRVRRSSYLRMNWDLWLQSALVSART